MSPSKSVPDGELIVAHAPFVRALALRLVFDAELAKDVEQDVLLAALENAPRDERSIKSWLASIVRHVASKAFRARTRRVEHESAAANEPVPTPAEILAREDVRRSLIEHVLSLDEPVRAVMILRFFEELPPREVARRLGIPVETVRTRIKRGVDALRSRLEREPGKGKDAWCLALVTGLKIQPPSLFSAGIAVLGASFPGVLVMGALKKVAVALVLLALATTAWVAIERVERPSVTEKAVLTAPAPSEWSTPTPDAAAIASGEDSRTAIAEPLAQETPKPPPITGSLRLILHWFDATPATGVNASIHQTGTDRFDGNLAVTSGEDGTIVIGALPPGRHDIFLDRGPYEHCDVVAGERVEVEITIPRGFDVSGRVVERGGRSIAGADILLNMRGNVWDQIVATRSDVAGRFKIRSVGEGLAWVSARAALHGPSAQRELVGGSTAVENVELVLDSAGASLEGVVYDFAGQPLQGARILFGIESHYRQVNFDDGGRGIAPAPQSVVSDERGKFVIPGAPIGKSPVQARASGHAPWSGEVEIVDQHTARLEIRLVKCTTLTGRVTDSSGAPVADAAIHGNGSYAFASRSAQSATDGTFTMGDLPAGEFHVSLEAVGFEGAETTLLGSPGAKLSWEPVLGSGASIRGRLVLESEDFSKWNIHCEAQAQGSFRQDLRPSAEGVFEVRGCVDGAYTIEVRSGAADASWFYPVIERKDVHPGGPELVITIDPALPPTCKLRGRFVDDRRQPIGGIQYVVGREGRNSAPILTAESDGTFEIGLLPPGKYGIGVIAQGFAPLRGVNTEVAAGATWDFGDLELERGGTIEVHLTRDSALADAQLRLYASIPGSGSSAWLPIAGDVANSQTLAPGDYIVELRADNEADEIARRSLRASVRAGEKVALELAVDSGVPVRIAITPPGNDTATIQALDAAGTVLWEGQAWSAKSIVLPRTTTRLVARDDAGHGAELEVAGFASLRGQSITLALK